MENRRLRFRDLKARGIVNNRVTLRNWQKKYSFPIGQATGPNTRTWGEDEVQSWLETRPTAPKAAPIVKCRRGRPRKADGAAGGAP